MLLVASAFGGLSACGHGHGSSRHEEFQVLYLVSDGTIAAAHTDANLLNGWGIGESHLGAYAQKARVNGDWLIALPRTMSTRDAPSGWTTRFASHGEPQSAHGPLQARRYAPARAR